MVRFALFNELSLPFHDSLDIEQHFDDFLFLVKKLQSKNIEKIRVERAFKEFEVLQGVYLQQFLGQIKDKELKDKLRSFLANRTIKIESPLINQDEDEYENILENEYFYNDISNTGALASADIWNTIAISFYSNQEWNNSSISLNKESITERESKKIIIRHASTLPHLDEHHKFFEMLEECIQLDITALNFWSKKDELFKEKIILCDDITKQIIGIDAIVFSQALSILRDIECNNKTLDDFNISSEGKSVSQNPKLRKLREFQIGDKKEYFQKHIKNLSNGYRIHFFEKNNKIYIGYIGKHLPTKNF